MWTLYRWLRGRAQGVPMNKPTDIILADDGPLSEHAAQDAQQDWLRAAVAALDEIMAAAHEAGDWRALRVLHSITALLTASRH